MPYRPTVPVVFGFVGSYTPPTSVTFSFLDAGVEQSPEVDGFMAALFGGLTIENRNRRVWPNGIAPTSEIGTLGIERYEPDIRQYGSDYSAFGTPTLSIPSTQIIEAAGFDSMLFSQNPRAFFRITLDFVVEAYTPAVPVLLDFVNTDFLQGLTTISWFSQLMGTPTIESESLSILPSGIDSLRMGVPTVEVDQTEIIPSGNTHSLYGEPMVAYRVRTLLGVTLGAQGAIGTAFVEAGDRTVDVAGNSILGSLFGNALVAYKNREVFPVMFLGTIFGTPAVDRVHFVEPGGIDQLAFGTAEVHRPRTFVSPLPWDSSAVGEPTFDQDPRSIYPTGFRTIANDTRYGVPNVRNNVLYINQLFEPDITADGGIVGQPLVQNRNIYMTPISLDYSSIGTPEIRLNARLLFPGGEEQLVFGDTLVAHAIRSVTPEGWDSFYTSQWHNVRNTAMVLAHQGHSSQLFGNATIENTRRYFNIEQSPEHSLYGTPMVAYRVRGVSLLYGIEPGQIGLHAVQNWQRYITPAGEDMSRVAAPQVEERFTRILPASILSGFAAGIPAVHNVTPQLYANGNVLTEFGQTKVRNAYETYTFAGWNSLAFGQAMVRDRTARPQVFGWHSLAFGTHHVFIDGPEPPGQRTISPFSLGDPLHGTEAFGGASVRTNVLYPVGIDSKVFGTPSVREMNIRPTGIPPPYIGGSQFGTPALNPARYLPITGIPAGEVGKPSLSPHTIWADSNAPQQAVDNHGGVRFQPIDAHLPGTGTGASIKPIFGNPVVTHFNRSLPVQGIAPPFFDSVHTVTNRQRYVQPTGTRFTRYGFPRLNGGGEVEPLGFGGTVFGQPTVGQPAGDPVAFPAGFVATRFGDQLVQNFIQHVTPAGFDALRATSPTHDLMGDNTKNLGHWVSHEYEPFAIPGIDAGAIGTAWVSFRIRHLEVEGYDASIVALHDPLRFADRMRVRKRNTFSGVSLGMTSALGVPTLGLAVRGIAPHGWDSGRSGQAELRARSVIEPTGFDGAVFGDIQQWEAGKVKPHGDEMTSIGTARITYVLHPAGFVGDVGAPSVSFAITPQGFDSSAFEQPVIVGFHCRTRARPVVGFMATLFGNATVSQ